MRSKEVVGTYQSVDEVIQKVDALKSQGYMAEEIMVFGEDATKLSILPQSTGVRLLMVSDLSLTEYEDVGKRDGISVMVNTKDMAMDSQNEQSASGQPLDGQSEEQHVEEGPDTVPRLNTRNL